MDMITLTQYILRYCQIIRKIEGIDEFQKVCRFLQGLHHKYKTKVKTQNPKKLEDEIKSTQIYDDVIKDKHSHVFTKSSSHSTHGVLNSNAKI